MRRSLPLLLLLLVAPLGQLVAQPVAEPSRPNFLVIVTDDQRFDELAFMPRTVARLFDEGITFDRAYVTTPLCCPSRSSILTGMYARHHGVQDNATELTVPTVAQHLVDAGYFSGMVGKYLNSDDGTPLPEFDHWVRSDGGTSTYVDARLNVNGTWTSSRGYLTHVLRDHALDFLEQASKQADPFFLLFTPKAPHLPATPAPGDETLYADLPPHRPPSYNESDVSDKPAWVRKTSRWRASRVEEVDDLRLRRLQTLRSTDLAIDSLLDTLEASRELDRTVVIFLSDNGYLLGEHRLEKKSMYYEEAVRVPFGVRYPPLIAMPRTENRLVANIDIAPTLYELAGITPPNDVDGRSLVPLFSGTRQWREDLLLEGWVRPRYDAVHTGRWIYVEIEGDIPELYDLRNDPYQLRNLARNPRFEAQRSQMEARLRAYDESSAEPTVREAASEGARDSILMARRH